MGPCAASRWTCRSSGAVGSRCAFPAARTPIRSSCWCPAVRFARRAGAPSGASLAWIGAGRRRRRRSAAASVTPLNARTTARANAIARLRRSRMRTELPILLLAAWTVWGPVSQGTSAQEAPLPSGRIHFGAFQAQFGADGVFMLDGRTGENVLWRTAIPGLAHSSPVVWGDRVFVTSAVSSRPGASFKPGLYGDGDASDDRSPQQWTIFAVDKKTGKIAWQRVAYEG